MDKEFNFGNGSLRENEWNMILDIIHKYDIKSVLEIGSGFSTICFEQNVDFIDSYESNINFYNFLDKKINKIKTNLISYSYPNFSKNNKKYDFCLIDGPGNNYNGRKNSMLFAVDKSNKICIHDYNRKAEHISFLECFPENTWKKVGVVGSLIFIQKYE